MRPLRRLQPAVRGVACEPIVAPSGRRVSFAYGRRGTWVGMDAVRLACRRRRRTRPKPSNPTVLLPNCTLTLLYSYPTVLLPYCTLTLLYSYCTPTHSNRRQNVAFQSPPTPPLIALIVRARMNLTYHMSAGGGLYPCTHIPLHPSYERRRRTVPMYPCTHAPSYELRRKLVPMYPCTHAPLHPSYERRRRA